MIYQRILLGMRHFQTTLVENIKTYSCLQASVPADLKLSRDLGTNCPPIIVINSQPPVQEHCIIGWSGLQQEITVLLYIAPSAYDRDS